MNKENVPDTHTPRILIIDDEPRIRDACKIVLSEHGFEVICAEDGERGLELIRDRHFDIILVDLMMPTISGFDVLSHVRTHHPDTVVIVITGYATLEHSIEAMKKGAFDFIPKPFTPDQLRAVVDKSLQYTRALQDIAESKSRLRVMVNRLSDGVMTIDIDKNIVQVNPAFLHMLNYHGSEVVGKPVDEVIEDTELLAAIDTTLAMPTNTFSEIGCELTIGESGNERFLSGRCSPFRDRLNENIGSIIVLHDITALKKMDQMKSDFVSMVSHEIRGPMNSLLMQFKIILDGLAGEVTDKQREILERASDKVLNLNSLVTELLDLSRIESGLIAHEKEQVDMSALLTELKNFHQAAANEKQITIELDCEAGLPEIFANRQNMEELFSNLITNGIKYSPERASIYLQGVQENDWLKITVRDTGFGMRPKDMEKLFTRFYRVKDEDTRTIQGTGLGLSIVKSIVDSHHGSIKVQSEKGQGTTFTVLLPVNTEKE